MDAPATADDAGVGGTSGGTGGRLADNGAGRGGGVPRLGHCLEPAASGGGMDGVSHLDSNNNGPVPGRLVWPAGAEVGRSRSV